MSARRILAVARRIAQGFRRDERTLGLIFIVPIVVTALLGWVLREQADTVVRVGVINLAGEAGDRIVAGLGDATKDSTEITIVLTTTDLEEGRQAIRDGRADVMVGLPATLLESLKKGERPTFVVLTGGTDPAADGAAMARLTDAMVTAARRLAGPGDVSVVPQVVHETVYLSPEADQLDVLSPVLLGYFGYFFVFLLTGISFLRERVGGTLERLLATPVTRGEIVLGYGLGFGVFATLQVVLLTAFVLGHVTTPEIGPIPSIGLGLGVANTGNPVLAFLVALVLSLGAVNLGIFLSTFARTELQIIQFIPLVIVPQGLLGGIFWPTEQLPDVLRVVADVMPMKYAVEALREVMLKGADLSSPVVAGDLAILAVIAVVFVGLATVTIKREVA